MEATGLAKDIIEEKDIEPMQEPEEFKASELAVLAQEAKQEER